jgi:predicted DCC family thiol-disulfide oxidoreductase YuxK
VNEAHRTIARVLRYRWPEQREKTRTLPQHERKTTGKREGKGGKK